jgi:hypothetical protein
MTQTAIDVDAATTWPEDVRKLADEIAGVVRGTARYVNDMAATHGSEDRFRRLFVGRRLRAYHATRLLDHEVALIREQGLRTLTEALIQERVNRAHAEGHLSSEDRATLLAGNVFAEGRSHGRRGHASLFISATPLDRQVYGVRPLLSTWGGEGIYMAQGGWSLRHKLACLGRPTIVVLDVDLGPRPEVHGIYPDLWRLFVCRLLGREPLGADLLYKQSVSPSGIVRFSQPGDPEYDIHAKLPRT